MSAPIFPPAPAAAIPAPLLWTRFQASKRLNISLRFLDHLIADGRLKVTRLNSSVRISDAALLEFIASCERPA